MYDAAYGYEVAHIVQDGIERMYGGNHPDPDVMYYLTVYNEPMRQPAEPEDVDVEGIRKGLHRVSVGSGDGQRVQLLASGVGVPWAIEAQELLLSDWGVSADVWSVTSWTELRRDGLAADEHNFLHPEEEPRTAYLTEKLKDAQGPFIATSDYMHAVQDQIRQWVPGAYYTLAPTASASPTHVPPRAGSSRSTARRWWCVRCRLWPTRAASTGRSWVRRSRSTTCTT